MSNEPIEDLTHLAVELENIASRIEKRTGVMNNAMNKYWHLIHSVASAARTGAYPREISFHNGSFQEWNHP